MEFIYTKNNWICQVYQSFSIIEGNGKRLL